MRSMLWILIAVSALGGCSVAMNGHHTAASQSAVSVSSQGQVRAGQAAAGISFGTPAPSGSPGGHASVSRGAAVAVLLGLVIADVVHYFSASSPALARASEVSIAATCSCYGYQPTAPDSGATSRAEKAVP